MTAAQTPEETAHHWSGGVCTLCCSAAGGAHNMDAILMPQRTASVELQQSQRSPLLLHAVIQEKNASPWYWDSSRLWD